MENSSEMSRNHNFTPFSYGSGKKPDQQSQKPNSAFNAVPPPAALNASRQLGNRAKTSYTSVDAIPQVNPANYGSKKRSTATLDDEYFDDDEHDEDNNLAYIPAANSPAAMKNDDSDDDDEDPLDLFMAGLEKEQKKEKEYQEICPQTSTQSISKGVRVDIDDMDNEESYYKYMEDNPMAGVADENSEDEMEYDEDGNPIVVPKKKIIDPLPSIDHSQIDYPPFEKNFYQPHEEISKLTKVQKDELRHKIGIKVMGAAVPAPICSFAHFGFDEQLMKVIRKSEYVSPTPIQAQSIPAALSGRDIIGIAKTGSGKTAAFLWPLIVHIMDQQPLQPGDGIIGLILAPTRELSIQIYNEAKKFSKAYNIEVVCCYGGGNKYEQSKALAAGAEICVATPGRMIDMIKLKATNLLRCSYLVLDEADKMFNMV